MVKKSLTTGFIVQTSEMAGSGKSTSIVSSFSTLLMEAWQKWDVRGMVLFSLILQIVLSVLGRRRKYKINPFFKTILWFAYLGADWIAIASLGKLSGSYTESPATNVLRAYWAPLLLLHLGGPDTVTAYAFEDNKLWIRHLLILVVKAILVIYVVCLSWTFSWLSFLSLPLILAGIIKYVEKIWCLKLNNSQEKKPVISNIFNPRGQPHPNENEALDRLLKEHPNVFAGYLLFIIMRPDVNDYFSSHSISDTGIRLKAYLKETTGIDSHSAFAFAEKYVHGVNDEEFFEALSVELGFMFDVVYTKAALIYTKLGCLLRLTSFASSLSVLLLFFISIINERKFHFSRIDIAITGILLSGAIALELYATWVMLSSDWAVLVMEFHHNVLVRKIFKAALKCFPLLLSQSKRWSNQMGQFDLLEYCWRYKKKKANQSCGILRKITNCNEIAEMWRKYWFTKFVNIPNDLQQRYEAILTVLKDLFQRIVEKKSMKLSRGEKALERRRQFDQLKWSIELDFDHSIIIWHLATSVCYLQEDDHDDIKEISRYLSNYMMYLLVMCPALILPEHSKSFWLDHAYDKLNELLFSTTDPRNAASTLVPDHVHEEELQSNCSEHEEEVESIFFSCSEHEEKVESRRTTLENILQKDVSKLASLLKQLENKWEVIGGVWIEMLVYAALSSPHINHIKQLGEGIEFLSLIWLSIGPAYIERHLKEE